MIDLTKITSEQANKIECALFSLERDVKEFIKANDYLANDKDVEEKTRETLKANANWWREVYTLIYGTEAEQ